MFNSESSSPRVRPRSYLWLLALSVTLSCAAADERTSDISTSHPTNPAIKAADLNEPNGISVGRPKIFDNRSLALMLDAMNEQLRAIQVINQTTLATALGTQQGFSSTESLRALTLTSASLPGTERVQNTTTGNVTDSGTALPDTSSDKITTTRAAVTPQIPGLDAPGAFSGFTPAYGESATDLLADQANLTYQIFNTRMILERSLSDRLWNGEPRLQALLGFNVTIDPPRTAEDSVAVVEVTLKQQDDQGPIELVSMMPQEKTYNAAALNTKQNAFGAAVAVKSIQAGFASRDKSQIFYLYRDVDTIAFERMQDDRTLVFGWMFRPVLGRPSVSPGLRQLFAIASLPGCDALNADQATGANGSSDPLRSTPKCARKILNAEVRNYWKRYDQKTMTSFYRSADATRTTNFIYGISLGLARPKIFADRYINKRYFDGIAVEPTNRFQTALRARVSDVTWMPIGPQKVLVTVKGDNFFTGTAVVIGDRTYSSPADGLILKSNQAFDLILPFDALTNAPGAIISRYGEATPLYPNSWEDRPAPPRSDRCEPGDKIAITSVTTFPPSVDRRAMEFAVESGKFSYTSILNGPRGPLLFVNGHAVPPPYDVTLDSGGSAIARAYPSKDLVTDEGSVVRLTFPFAPPNCSATKLAPNPDKQYRLTRLASNRVLLVTQAWPGFERIPGDHKEIPAGKYCWKIMSGNQTLTAPTKDCSTAPTTGSISDYSVIFTGTEEIPNDVILISPLQAVTALSVPKAEAASTKSVQPIVLNQNSALWVEIPFENPVQDLAVEANKIALDVMPVGGKKPSKKWMVGVTRDITKKVGDVDLKLSADEKVSLSRLSIICPYCSDGEHE